MKLLGDIKSERLLYFKGFLFLILGLIAVGGLLLEYSNWRHVALLIICIWAFCRFYYFLFYVIEKYADPEFKFAGIGSFVKYMLTRKSGPPTEVEDPLS